MEPPPPRLPFPDWVERAGALGWTWCVNFWRRAADVPGAWFDAKKAQGVVDLWPRIIKLTDDRFAGLPFELSFWEECVVRLVFGWKVQTEILLSERAASHVVHTRLIREVRLWMPRKGGKTEFISALGVITPLIDGTIGGQGYVFAKDLEQGAVPFGKMQAMVSMAPPSLSGNAQLMKKVILFKRLKTIFRLLPGIPDGKHGKSPTVIVGDEMHEWMTSDLMTTLRQGTGTRLQPLSIYASTAGLKSNPVGWELYQESLAIHDGIVDNPRLLVVIFAAADGDDIYDEATWRKANPSYPVTPVPDFMRSEAALAKGNPRREAHFKAYHLGIWVDSDQRWLPLRQWDACGNSNPDAWRTRLADLKGRTVIGFFDVSATQDVTALIWWAPPTAPGGKIEIGCRFWIPEETLKKRAEADKRAPWLRWVEIGAIETTPGAQVEQLYVANAIREAKNIYAIQRIGFDPWNAAGVVEPLQGMASEAIGSFIPTLNQVLREDPSSVVAKFDMDGFDPSWLVKVPTNIATLTAGSKEFERLVFGGKIDHGNHPVLRWMAGNAVVRMAENDNFMPSKRRSHDKIDGIVGCVGCCALSLAPAPPSGTFTYEQLYGSAA